MQVTHASHNPSIHPGATDPISIGSKHLSWLLDSLFSSSSSLPLPLSTSLRSDHQSRNKHPMAHLSFAFKSIFFFVPSSLVHLHSFLFTDPSVKVRSATFCIVCCLHRSLDRASKTPARDSRMAKSNVEFQVNVTPFIRLSDPRWAI